jgi:hypothetical protein
MWGQKERRSIAGLFVSARETGTDSEYEYEVVDLFLSLDIEDVIIPEKRDVFKWELRGVLCSKGVM